MLDRDELRARLPTCLEELEAFLRIPSVSSRPEHAGDVRRAARWLVDHLEGLGLAVSRVETAGHPLVVARDGSAGNSRPTVVIYGHYDVQPVDPLEAWETDPFEPVRRAGRLYARGAVDNKGQLFVWLKALDLLRIGGDLPVNVTLLVEGEEEVGSRGALDVVAERPEWLRGDALLVSDSNLWSPDRPAILVGLRGIVYLEVEVVGPPQDLHSGNYGGAVVNPLNVLVRMLAGLQGPGGRVAAEGFYDAVEPLDRRTRELIPEGYGERVIAETGVSALGGEAGCDVAERVWFRPSLDINGIVGGYTGPGAKTVIPSRSRAKLSSRLVEGQRPGEVARTLVAHLRGMAAEGVQVEVRVLSEAKPWRARTGHPLYDLAREALARAFPEPAIFVGDGGSLPLIPALEEATGAPALLMGFGLPGSNEHAPNEWLSLEAFERGILVATELLERIGELGAAGWSGAVSSGGRDARARA